jgi:hypothetical protein
MLQASTIVKMAHSFAKFWLHVVHEAVERPLLRDEWPFPDLCSSTSLNCRYRTIGDDTRPGENGARFDVGGGRPAELHEPERSRDVFVGLADGCLRPLADGLKVAIDRARELPVRIGTDVTEPASAIGGNLTCDLTARFGDFTCDLTPRFRDLICDLTPRFRDLAVCYVDAPSRADDGTEQGRGQRYQDTSPPAASAGFRLEDFSAVPCVSRAHPASICLPRDGTSPSVSVVSAVGLVGKHEPACDVKPGIPIVG